MNSCVMRKGHFFFVSEIVLFRSALDLVLREGFDDESNLKRIESSKYMLASELMCGQSIQCKSELIMFHLNCRGLNSSNRYLSELVRNGRDIQILGLTETWLTFSNEALLDINGDNFSGEIGISRGSAHMKSDLDAKVREGLSVYSEILFESMVLEIKLMRPSIYLVIDPHLLTLPVF